MTGLLANLFGAGTWGTGGNMVAWVICGTLGFGWLHSKNKARAVAAAALAARHHAEALDQAQGQHEETLALARKHQQELLDRADVHHEALAAKLGKQSQHLVRQDNAMRDLKGGSR